MPRAIRLIPANIPFIVTVVGGDASELKDNYWYHHEDGDVCYLITDGAHEDNNITSTIMIQSDFDRLWRFTDGERFTIFADVERIPNEFDAQRELARSQ
jgi:hypothetical protein